MNGLSPRLELQGDQLVLIAGEGSAPAVLSVSPSGLAARHWPRGRPDGLGLERAIDDTENAIEGAGLVHGDRDTLAVSRELWQRLPQGLTAAQPLSREAVEAEFSRLAAQGARPQTGSWAAAEGESAATVLLVRELLHHLGFRSVIERG